MSSVAVRANPTFENSLSEVAAAESEFEDALTSSLVVKLGGASLTSFNPLTAPVYFQMSKGKISALPEDVTVTRNGATIPASKLTVISNRVSVADALIEGKNEFRLKVYDTQGVPVFYTATVWAGTRELTVNVVNADGAPLTSKITVTAKLGDDQNFLQAKSSKGGVVKFTNVPDRTIFIQGKSGALFGFIGVTGSVGTTQLVMRSLQPAAPTTALSVLPESAIAPASTAPTLIYGETFFTTNEGETNRTQSFTVAPGISTVRIRYRFNTSEVPGGFFGTKYNDYFRVLLRSPTGGEVFEANSMNGLGLAAFDGSGSTAWREKTLKVSPKGEVITFDGAVANVGDGLYDSSLEVSIEALKADISYKLQWDSANGGLKVNWLAKSEIAEDTPVYVFFANGLGWSNRLGASVFNFTIPGGTKANGKGIVQVPGGTLNHAPVRTTHVLVASGDADAQAIKDVVVDAPGVDTSLLNTSTYQKIKNALRFAGQSSAAITSTIRQPADQARAMWKNLVNPKFTVEQNIANQRAIVGAVQEEIIDVFEDSIVGLTYQQIIDNSVTIRQAMTDKIVELANAGKRVSKHCVTPAQYSLHNIVDIGRDPNAQARGRFLSEIAAQGVFAIDEPNNGNGAIHLEF